jgi:hypothetical protein
MRGRKVNFVVSGVFSFVATATLSACSQSARSTQPPPQTQQYLTHTVQYSGETLANISKWYTGQPSNWTIIQEANPSLNPRKLRIGYTVQIPQSLIVRADAFPKPKTTQVVRQDTPALEPASDSNASPQTTDFTYKNSAVDSPQAAALVGDNSSTALADQGNLPTSPDLVVSDSSDLADRASSGEFSDTSIQNSALEDTATGAVPPPPQSKTGIISGLLEAVGNAAINAKQQESTTTSK